MVGTWPGEGEAGRRLALESESPVVDPRRKRDYGAGGRTHREVAILSRAEIGDELAFLRPNCARIWQLFSYTPDPVFQGRNAHVVSCLPHVMSTA